MAPVGAPGERPPLAEVAQVDRVPRWRERQRARIDHVRENSGIILRIRRNLRDGDVTRLIDEFLELAVRHRMPVDPEAVDLDAMDRRFLGVMPVGAHAERAARNEQHLRRIRTAASFECRQGSDRLVQTRLQHVHRPSGGSVERERPMAGARRHVVRRIESLRASHLASSDAEGRNAPRLARRDRAKRRGEGGSGTLALRLHARPVGIGAVALVPRVGDVGPLRLRLHDALVDGGVTRGVPAPRPATQNSQRGVRPSPRWQACSRCSSSSSLGDRPDHSGTHELSAPRSCARNCT